MNSFALIYLLMTGGKEKHDLEKSSRGANDFPQRIMDTMTG
jgi:hypothetical protein